MHLDNEGGFQMKCNMFLLAILTHAIARTSVGKNAC